jgi:hypothetical protein
MDKFKNKLPKEDLKKFAKEIGKKLVASDYKNNRVEDPTKITSKQEKKVRKYVRDFFEKAVAKKAAHDKLKSEKKAKANSNGGVNDIINSAPPQAEEPLEIEDEMEMSADEDEPSRIDDSQSATPIPVTPSEENLKRKRDEHSEIYDSTTGDIPHKRLKDEDDVQPSPPPPPPPPPAEDLQTAMQMDEDAELAAQEESLMRENEEALIRENEEALRDAEAHQNDSEVPIPGSIDDVDAAMNGATDETKAVVNVDGESEDIAMKEVNGNATPALKGDASELAHRGGKDVPEANSVEENLQGLSHERKQVLSH